MSISNLFEPLPVRRGEFKRNIKKQYNRLLRVMQAYALVSLGVRITLTNTRAKGGKKIEIATQVPGLPRASHGLVDSQLSDRTQLVAPLVTPACHLALLVLGTALLENPPAACAPPHASPMPPSAISSPCLPPPCLGVIACPFACQYKNKLEDNVTNVFGPKFLSTLVPLRVDLGRDREGGPDSLGSQEESEEGVGATGAPVDADPAATSAAVSSSRAGRREVFGMVSKAGEGVGRADNDRQFSFVNGRPVDLPKVKRDQRHPRQHQ